MKTNVALHMARSALFGLFALWSSHGAAAPASTTLAQYYPQYGPTAIGLPNPYAVEIHVTGGGIDPPSVTYDGQNSWPVTRVMRITSSTVDPRLDGYPASSLRFEDSEFGPCLVIPISIPRSMVGGTQQNVDSGYLPASTSNPPPNQCDNFTKPAAKWTFQDAITYGAPVRRKAMDGSEYDASPMVIKRNGLPWMTYYWGYRLGLVASESNWNPSDQSKVPMLADWPNFPTPLNNFELAKLPPPFIEGEIVEYVNYTVSPASPVGHFFYASNANEQALLDQIPQWTRTGRSFKSGGYVSVCRFYGSVSPGPNTHFYSADANECKVVLPGISALHDEGLAFRASRPIPATPSRAASCPTATIPLYRLYNNPAGRSFDSNHRYLTDDKIAQAMVSAGWVHEGLVMCVPQ